MKQKDFITALEIISEQPSTEILINRIKDDNYILNLTIHIKACVPALIKNLIKFEFHLSMDDGMLRVDKN